MLELPRTNVADAFARLIEIVAHLRSDEGCPWDRAQTHESLRNDLVEETYEVVEAVDNGEATKLADELGDLLLCVALYAQIAEDAGEFSMLDVLNAVNAKLIRRHPHVFAEVEVSSTDDVLRNWDAIKQNETAHESRESALDGVPPGLPALMAARKLQRKAARVGFDWERVEDVLPKVYEELREVEEHLSDDADPDRRESEIGDLLFAVVNLARFLNVEPEGALRRANSKFSRRFRRIEAILEERGETFGDHDIASLDRIWDAIKSEERRERLASSAPVYHP
jgi:tetrapyrrole methylase family protein/MazG family protein